MARSPAMLEALRRARLYAPEEDPVVLVGETGTGKSFLARRIHEWSGRGGTLAEVSGGELKSSLVPDELFGHERGAFTGAQGRRAGLLGEAGAGTVLLDDAHLLTRLVQGMLLRVLDVGDYRRLGTDRRARLVARVIVGTGVHPEELVRRGVWLADLWYRLGYMVVDLPPLRERVEDIASLAAGFLRGVVAAHGGREKTLAPEAVAALELASWPGNVRELDNVVRVAYVVSRDQAVIGCEHLPREVRVSPRFDRAADPCRLSPVRHPCRIPQDLTPRILRTDAGVDSVTARRLPSAKP